MNREETNREELLSQLYDLTLKEIVEQMSSGDVDDKLLANAMKLLKDNNMVSEGKKETTTHSKIKDLVKDTRDEG